jgi:hypothetical protein
MSKRATVQPPWLDRLLIGWGLKSLHQHGKGWYSINPSLKDGIATGRPPAEPFELGGEDYAALDAAICALPDVQRAAIIRAYKPWTAPSIDALGFVPTSTWCMRLKAAAQTLAIAMQRKVAFDSELN